MRISDWSSDVCSSDLRNVAIRGIPSDLNNYTVNGFELGNPDGNTRRLPLDIVSGQLLNRVEVTKAQTADLDAQGIGGMINLVTQTAFDFAEPFILSANAQVGYQIGRAHVCTPVTTPH